MALHSDLTIHKTGCELLELAFKVQASFLTVITDETWQKWVDEINAETGA